MTTDVMIRCDVCGKFHNALRTTTFHIDGKERVICLSDVQELFNKMSRHFPRRRQDDRRTNVMY